MVGCRRLGRSDLSEYSVDGGSTDGLRNPVRHFSPEYKVVLFLSRNPRTAGNKELSRYLTEAPGVVLPNGPTQSLGPLLTGRPQPTDPCTDASTCRVDYHIAYSWIPTWKETL